MSINTYSIAELLGLKPPAWIIDGVIPEQGFTALYGKPGDGKSFLALDMAMSIATGLPWQGHPTQKGYVVYISAEGGAGLGKRVGAWLQHKHIVSDDYKHLLMNFVTSAVHILPESDDIGEILAQTIEHHAYQELLLNTLGEDETGPPFFIVVDTLARCFDGDENQQEDMNNFIKGLDYLRDTFAATVLVIHHTNKGGFEERGSSSFRGACDAMMSLEKVESALTLTCTKQKDAEPFLEEAYELVVMPDWNSCVVVSEKASSTLRQHHMIDVLKSFGPFTYSEWLEASELPKTTFKRFIVGLTKSGTIIKENELYSFSDQIAEKAMGLD